MSSCFSRLHGGTRLLQLYWVCALKFHRMCFVKIRKGKILWRGSFAPQKRTLFQSRKTSGKHLTLSPTPPPPPHTNAWQNIWPLCFIAYLFLPPINMSAEKNLPPPHAHTHTLSNGSAFIREIRKVYKWFCFEKQSFFMGVCKPFFLRGCGGKNNLTGPTGYLIQLSPAMRQGVLCHMRTTKAQISLRFRAVWSAPLLFAA